MSNIKALKAGNHNDPTVWDGGVIPGIGDSAFSNNFSVTIVDDWELDLISNAADVISGAVDGGKFILSTPITLTSDVQAGAYQTIDFNANVEVYIIGTVTGGTSNYAHGFRHSGGLGAVHISSCIGGTGNSTNGYACWGYDPMGVAYIGSSYASDFHSSSSGIYLLNATTVVCYVDYAIGSDITSAVGIGLNKGTLIAIDIEAGVFGRGLTAGAVATQVFVNRAISSTSHSIVAIESTTILPVIVKEIDMRAGGTYPIKNYHKFVDDIGVSMAVNDEDGVPLTLVLADSLAPEWYPATNNVRSGVSYANGGLIGTCKVPDPSNVALNVEVDNTVGTALINPDDLLDALTTSLSEALSPEWYPAANNVRFGTSYANGGLVGTCKIPPPESVVLNVEVDDTVGTAMITQGDLLNAMGTMFAAYFP